MIAPKNNSDSQYTNIAKEATFVTVHFIDIQTLMALSR